MTRREQTEKPRWPYTNDFVTGYPLTEDELYILGVHWAELQLDNSAWCVLASTSGSIELRVSRYTAERLEMITDLLHGERTDAIYAEAENRVREKLGEECWAAFKEGVPLIRESIDGGGDGDG